MTTTLFNTVAQRAVRLLEQQPEHYQQWRLHELMRTPRRARCTILGLLVILLHVGSRTPGAVQNALASMGVVPMLGVPQYCGSDARRTRATPLSAIVRDFIADEILLGFHG